MKTLPQKYRLEDQNREKKAGNRWTWSQPILKILKTSIKIRTRTRASQNESTWRNTNSGTNNWWSCSHLPPKRSPSKNIWSRDSNLWTESTTTSTISWTSSKDIVTTVLRPVSTREFFWPNSISWRLCKSTFRSQSSTFISSIQDMETKICGTKETLCWKVTRESKRGKKKYWSTPSALRRWSKFGTTTSCAKSLTCSFSWTPVTQASGVSGWVGWTSQVWVFSVRATPSNPRMDSKEVYSLKQYFL